jgi:hypothetical protein
VREKRSLTAMPQVKVVGLGARCDNYSPHEQRPTIVPSWSLLLTVPGNHEKKAVRR